MLAVITWWLIIQVFALAALPLGWKLFAALPDRGYAFTKPLALLLVSYLLWLGASLGFIGNDAGGILLSLILVAGLSLWLGGNGLRVGDDGRRPMAEWFRKHRGYILACESLFLIAFAAWAWFRAFNPELNSTEKPMELAFLNGILRSSRFPPLDPWLSGYSISYYYFGYVMLAVMTRLSGVPASVGFNVGLAMWFALVALGAFGVAYNLVGGAKTRRAVAFGLVGALLVVGIGNLEGVFEFAHAKGIGSPAFYRWLDINNLDESLPKSPAWYPVDNWWWWRASRVINDRDLTGRHVEVIDEFPFFSFLLGDMHPHVLGLPFVLMAIGLGLNLLAARSEKQPRAQNGPTRADEIPGGSSRASSLVARPRSWGGSLSDWRHFAGNVSAWLADAGENLASVTGLGATGVVLYALFLGGLGFLNTWDFPIYLMLFMSAYTMRRKWESGRLNRHVVGDILGGALILAVLGIVLYLPFYLGFTSQAGGILPNLLFPTRLRQFFIIFGPFFVPIMALLALLSEGGGGLKATSRWLRWFIWIVVLPVVFVLLIMILFALLPGQRAMIQSLLDNPAVQENIAGRSLPALLGLVLQVRITTPFVYLLLAGGLAWVGVLVWHRVREEGREEEPSDPQGTYALLMTGVAMLLVFSVEFVYLKDSFGTRMNTVFKFYYQAWILLALASAYAIYRLTLQRQAWARVAVGSSVFFIAIALIYPVMAIPTKADLFQGPATLDGTAYMKNYMPDEAAAIAWLQANVRGAPVVLEANGNSYTDAAHVSAQTGLPTLLGWGGHELQWRGNYDEPGRRERDIQTIYTTSDQAERERLLDRYRVEYIYVGRLERERFRLNDAAVARLAQNCDLVFSRGEVRIFRRRGAISFNITSQKRLSYEPL
jgi:uncharacterized membrane protein